MLDDEQKQAAWQAHIAQLQEHKKIDVLDVVNATTASLTLHSLLSMAANGLKNNFLNPEQKKELFLDLYKAIKTPELFNQIIEKTGMNYGDVKYAQAVLDNTVISPEEFTNICTLIDKNTAQYNAPWLNAIEEHFYGGMQGAVITASILAGVTLAAIIKMKQNEHINDKITEAELKAAALSSTPREAPSTHIATKMTDLRSTIENIDKSEHIAR